MFLFLTKSMKLELLTNSEKNSQVIHEICFNPLKKFREFAEASKDYPELLLMSGHAAHTKI